MHLVPPDASPFLVLWYVFLAFFGAVLVFQVFMLAVGQLLQWRIRAVTKKYSPRD